MNRINKSRGYPGFIGVRIGFNSFRYNRHNFIIHLGKSTNKNIVSIIGRLADCTSDQSNICNSFLITIKVLIVYNKQSNT